MKSIEQLAAAAYQAYCKQAGKTFDDKPLPSWEQLGADRRCCWVAATKQLWAEFTFVH